MRTACRLAGLSTHALYYRPEKNARPLNPESIELVRKVVEDRPFYGSRRVAASIRRNGTRLNRKAVQRIMRAMDWTLPDRKRERAAANTAKPVFIPTAPDQLWETDITYIWCGTDRWGYLFNHLDVFTRQWLAYTFSRNMRKRNAIDSLVNAVDGRDTTQLMLRSDNGSQFTSDEFMDSVKALGIRQEFIQVSTPEQDGHIESFHGTLKTEYIWPMEFSCFEEALECIEKAFCDYNNVRLHSALGYMTPNEYYRKWMREHGKEVEPSILYPAK